MHWTSLYRAPQRQPHPDMEHGDHCLCPLPPRQGDPPCPIPSPSLHPTRHVTWGPPAPVPPPDMGHEDPPPAVALALPTIDIWWPLLGTWSNLDSTRQGPAPTVTDIWWPPKHVRLATGRLASYWNALLLTFEIRLQSLMTRSHILCLLKMAIFKQELTNLFPTYIIVHVVFEEKV